MSELRQVRDRNGADSGHHRNHIVIQQCAKTIQNRRRCARSALSHPRDAREQHRAHRFAIVRRAYRDGAGTNRTQLIFGEVVGCERVLRPKYCDVDRRNLILGD